MVNYYHIVIKEISALNRICIANSIMSDCGREYILQSKIYTHRIKDIHKLEAIKLLPSEKELLKKRIKIER